MVMVDDFIPVGSGGKPSFANAVGKELWVTILEKAWAKMHKSYNRVQFGNAALTYRDMTGAPS